MNIPKKALLTFLCFYLTVFIAGCGNSQSSESKNVKSGIAGSQKISGTISVSGILDAEQSAAVSSQLTGTVTTLNIKEGQAVRKGEVLLSLDKRDLSLQLQLAQSNYRKSVEAVNQAKISYDDAQKAYNRYQELYQTGSVSQQDYEQITSKLNLAKSQYETAQGSGLDAAQNSIQTIENNLDKADLKSPLDGVIASCNVTPGESVTTGTPIVSLVSEQNLILNGNISESMVNYLKVGQKVDIITDSVPGTTYSGTIIFISPVSVSTGQFFPVKIKVENANHTLRIGMTGSASIKYEINAPLAVPNTSLFQQNGSDYVYLIKDGKAVRTPLKLGLAGDAYTVVISGLNPEEQIIVSEPLNILDGDSVTISQ
ncbi:efflux transporter, RND family, MFP subunit [Syntrophobotulus glycolicus DSM 8271]|uniref:Efflux transporter, RND family, MFP subunit n=1 Tax=Syntrophobotulus glycolicus (strain DSM 8271 / FlGlyR) TaxID=645991 RepID=F0SWB7_SYNGF|nr:efflux RND transporter periplasmic adaptor subunit [Syntrophobotulus glycolicus]ADY54603.1 efflux transporter, RND family, MFP subunit [Syntrophobotulus glycolicus DSM 8271]